MKTIQIKSVKPYEIKPNQNKTKQIIFQKHIDRQTSEGNE